MKNHITIEKLKINAFLVAAIAILGIGSCKRMRMQRM